METNRSKSVINFSHLTLNEHHISLLSKGLKFCPTPGHPNTGELREDLEKLHKNMRWAAFFDNSDSDPIAPLVGPSHVDAPDTLISDPFKHRKFRLKSSGKGPIGPLNLEAFIASNEKDFLNRKIFYKTHRNNLKPPC